MPKYSVVATVSGSKYLGEFEAATAEEAVQMALESEAAQVCLCHQCSDQCEDPECVAASADEVPNA
jgi:hypothetical protein